MVSVMDPYGRILGFLDRSRYFFFQAAPQLYSRCWVNSVPDALHLRKSSSAGNRTRTPESVARNSDHIRILILLAWDIKIESMRHNQFVINVWEYIVAGKLIQTSKNFCGGNRHMKIFFRNSCCHRAALIRARNRNQTTLFSFLLRWSCNNATPNTELFSAGNIGVIHSSSHWPFFFNPLLFASCTNTFNKWCKITRGMKRSVQ
jgi:hypothetical protein